MLRNQSVHKSQTRVPVSSGEKNGEGNMKKMMVKVMGEKAEEEDDDEGGD